MRLFLCVSILLFIFFITKGQKRIIRQVTACTCVPDSLVKKPPEAREAPEVQSSVLSVKSEEISDSITHMMQKYSKIKYSKLKKQTLHYYVDIDEKGNSTTAKCYVDYLYERAFN